MPMPNTIETRVVIQKKENGIVKRGTTSFTFEHQIFQADNFKCLLYLLCTKIMNYDTRTMNSTNEIKDKMHEKSR